MTQPRLILASTSPRRIELLRLLQIPFDAIDPAFVEYPSSVDPPAQAVQHAAGKATATSSRYPDALVLAADTLIDLDGRVIGKPNAEHDARVVLKALAGRDHVVHSAVALRRRRDGLSDNRIESVRVRMRRLSDRDLDRYLESGEWRNKAGAYAIQGAAATFIEAIAGDYTAVVGLPLQLVSTLLTPYIPVPVDIASLYQSRPYANWAIFPSH